MKRMYCDFAPSQAHVELARRAGYDLIELPGGFVPSRCYWDKNIPLRDRNEVSEWRYDYSCKCSQFDCTCTLKEAAIASDDPLVVAWALGDDYGVGIFRHQDGAPSALHIRFPHRVIVGWERLDDGSYYSVVDKPTRPAGHDPDYDYEIVVGREA